MNSLLGAHALQRPLLFLKHTKWYVIQALSFRHDFDGNGNEGSVNYSDGNEGSSKISMAVRGGKISNGTDRIGSK